MHSRKSAKSVVKKYEKVLIVTDSENIPPPSPLRTDSLDAYHSASSTQEPSPTRERSISLSGDLQRDKFRTCGAGWH